MSRWVAAVISLVLSGNLGFAQSNTGSAYVVTGLMVADQADFQDRFDVSLVNDSERQMAVITVHAQERFTFSDLDPGVYFIVADVPGYKPVRQRVEFTGGSHLASTSIVLEPQPVVVTVDRGGALVTDVSRMAQTAGLLKELAAAEKKLHEGHADDARIRLESIVGQAPEFFDAHRLLAMAYQAERRYSEAESEYRIAQKLNAASPLSWIGLASNYLEQTDADDAQRAGRLDAARNALLRAIKLDSQIAVAHYLLGITYHKLARNEEAEASLVRALELDPAFAKTHIALANVYIREQDWSRALAQIDLYIKQNPHAPDRDAILARRSSIQRVAAFP